MKQYSEMDRTILVLRELSQWSQRAESLKNEIESQRLDTVYHDLESLKSALSVLERKVPMVAILPKLQDRLQSIYNSAADACSDVWDRSISVKVDDESTDLTIHKTPGQSYIFLKLTV